MQFNILGKVILLCFLFNAQMATAQKGKNQIALIAEPCFAITDNYRIGFGLYGKDLYGLGKSTQLTFTTGMSRFYTEAAKLGEESKTVQLLPFLLGYRNNIKSVYIEPQVGYGIYKGNITRSGLQFKPSGGSFFLGLGTGYYNKRISAGIRFQSNHSKKNDLFGKSFIFSALHFGYSIIQ